MHVYCKIHLFFKFPTTRFLPVSRIWRRNITSEQRDSDCPFFCPLVVSGGIRGGESGLRDDTSGARTTKWPDYRSEEGERERARERGARLNAARCHFVWPLWELPQCMTQSTSACHWDSLGPLLLPPPPTDILAQLFLMPDYLPIDLTMANNSNNPPVLISSFTQLELNLNSAGSLCLCEVA